jgi:hypothetical protein
MRFNWDQCLALLNKVQSYSLTQINGLFFDAVSTSYHSHYDNLPPEYKFYYAIELLQGPGSVVGIATR